MLLLYMLLHINVVTINMLLLYVPYSINSRAGYFLQAYYLLVERYSRTRVKRGRAQFLWINPSMRDTKFSFGPGTLGSPPCHTKPG